MDTQNSDTQPDMTNIPKDVFQSAHAVLIMNDEGRFTIPAEGLYPHQWLWDSCFISIGLRHVDIDRAKTELRSLLRGQWNNGMLPHMIFADNEDSLKDRLFWRSSLNPAAPDSVHTSGITQPPMLAEAVVRVGQKLHKSERLLWYKELYPHLLAHHRWLFNERDPDNDGLVVQLHPYETGLDNTPPWIATMLTHCKPWWIRLLETLHIEKVLHLLRRDTKRIPPGQRMSNIEALIYFDVIRKLRKKHYDSQAILQKGTFFAIDDVTFNSIFLRANQLLLEIAAEIREELPEDLTTNITKSEQALEQLWDPYAGVYFSRNVLTKQLIKEPSIAALTPLYSRCITKERAQKLVAMLEHENQFGTPYPIPSVPRNTSWFDPVKYWQGPAWVNTNWLIIDGLRYYGFDDHADALAESTIDMVHKSGMYEYFNPATGEPAGAKNFSWTAALTMDLLVQSGYKVPK